MNKRDPLNQDSTILVVDDSPISRELTSTFLGLAGYEILEAENGEEALGVLETQNVDVVLLDILMPKLDGFETCRIIKSHPKWRFIPVIMLTGLTDVNDRISSLDAGADDLLTKPINKSELLARVKTSARLKRLIDQLEDTEGILFLLANVVEKKDSYTDRHLKRVEEYSLTISNLIGLSAEMEKYIRYGAIMHDIGKVGITDTILNKPARLTVEEYEVIKTHPVLGDEIIQSIRFGKFVGPIVRGHHERWDGNGYPDGLSGEDIPIGARIVAVSDSYDAMTSDRPYRKALSREQALKDLEKNAGKQFDPTIIDLFSKYLNKKYSNEGGTNGKQKE